MSGATVSRWTFDADSARRAATAYRATFGTDPVWRAGRWCKVCSTPSDELRWTFADAPERCPRCQGQLVDRWPEDELIAKFEDDLSRPGGVGFLAEQPDGEIVAGSISLLMPVEDVAAYLDLPDHVDRQLLSAVPAGARVVLWDLTFVHPDHQRRGWGRRLFEHRERWHQSLPRPPRCVVLRTARTPPTVLYAWYERIGFEVAAEYGDFLDRVLLTRSITPRNTAQAELDALS